MPPKKVSRIATAKATASIKGTPTKRASRRNGDPSVSNVFITVNTNRKPDAASDIQRIRAKLETATEEMTRNATGLDAVTDWYDERGWKGKNTITGATFNDSSLVQSVRTEYAVERGGKQNTMHVHIVVRVEHTGTLWFDRLKIKQYYANAMGSDMPKLPNVKVKLLGNPNEAEALRGYLIKDLVKQTSAHHNKPSK